MLLQAYDRLLSAKGGDRREGMRAVQDFIDYHLDQARRLGWSDVELFGCCPDPDFALVRYDCMGAVTSSALTGWTIVSVSADGIRYANGLASRRGQPASLARPVWEVLSADHAG